VPLPRVDLQLRVDQDIDALLEFIAQQPWGNRIARECDIWDGITAILDGPALNAVGLRRRDTGIELRRHNTAQFAIIYAYYEPSQEYPHGLVSIRAVRHSRVKQVFRGVRETPDIGTVYA
jgi:hypothetical protein